MAEPSTTQPAAAKGKTQKLRLVGTNAIIGGKLHTRGSVVEITAEQITSIGKRNLADPAKQWPPKSAKPKSEQPANQPPPRAEEDLDDDDEFA